MSKLGFLGIRGIRSYSNYGEDNDDHELKVLDFTKSPVTLILGENGSGKTVRNHETFVYFLDDNREHNFWTYWSLPFEQ